MLLDQKKQKSINIFSSKIPNAVTYAACLILGIIISDFKLNLDNTLIFTSIFSFIGLYFLLNFNLIKFNKVLALSLIFFLTGYIRHAQMFSAHAQLINCLSYKNLVLEAKIIDITIDKQKRLPVCLSLSINKLINKNNINDNLSSCDQQIVNIYTHETPQILDLKIGDLLSIDKIEFKKNYNLEFEKYLIKENILANIFINKLEFELKNLLQDSSTKILKISDKITIFKNNVINNLENKLSKKTFAYFASIFLGNKHVDEQELWQMKQDFNYWGLSHYLARSGLHLIMLVLILKLILSFIPLGFNVKNILTLSLILSYSVLSWSSISYSRSLIMVILYGFCNFLNLPIITLNILALTTILILMHNPFQLFFLDFQLSFGLTFALTLYTALKDN